MPKRKVQPDDVLIAKTIEKEQTTNTGIYVHAGDIDHSDYDEKNWQELQEDYVKMENGEPIISRCSKMLKMPILQSQYRLETGSTQESKDCADFIQFTYDHIVGGFQNLKYHKLMAINYGLSMGEMIWKKGEKFNGKFVNRLVKINHFQNETIERFYYDDYGTFTGIRHEKRVPEKASSYIDIQEGVTVDDIKNVLHWMTYQKEYDDIRGKSILRPLRTSWDAKVKVMQSMIRACQRGAGLPLIGTHGQPTSNDRASIETIGNTITHMNNGYVAYDMDSIEVRFEELKGQKDNMGLLEFINRELFFGMMLEFSTSGIGQSGSRAATESHKAPYELQANYILEVLEESFADLNDIIIKNSAWANIAEKEKPLLKFNSITQVDTFRLSQTMKNMYDTSIIQKKPEDEIYFREIFGLPQMAIGQETVNPELKKLSKQREMSKYEKEIFSLESATEGYLTAQEKTQMIIGTIYHNALNQVVGYLRDSGAKTFIIKKQYKDEMVNELTKLYESLFNRGRQDVNNEIAKLKKDYTLANIPGKKVVNNSITRMTDKFFFNVKTMIEDKIDKTNLDKTSLQEIVMGFEDSFKGDKRLIMQQVEDGYTDGRSDAMIENENQIEEYIYTAILDKSLCNECAPYDNLTFTKDELDSEGLNLGQGRVNSHCLGTDNCRCQIAPYTIKG
jgi:hypothetical protein